MPTLGPMEVMVILVVALLVLGPKKLPEAGRQVGKAIAEFRRWSTDMQSEVRAAISTDVEPDYGATVPTPATQPPPDAAPAPNGNVPNGNGRVQAGAPNPRPPSQFPDGQSFN